MSFFIRAFRTLQRRPLLTTRLIQPRRWHIPPPTQDHLTIGFTCKVCDHRQYKSMSKQAYYKGVVIIKCDGCKSMHLIADHLGWYEHGKPSGTIEDILKQKNEQVKKQNIGYKLTDNNGMLEMVPDMDQVKEE